MLSSYVIVKLMFKVIKWYFRFIWLTIQVFCISIATVIKLLVMITKWITKNIVSVYKSSACKVKQNYEVEIDTSNVIDFLSYKSKKTS